MKHEAIKNGTEEKTAMKITKRGRMKHKENKNGTKGKTQQ